MSDAGITTVSSEAAYRGLATAKTDEAGEFVSTVAVSPREIDQLARPRYHSADLGRTRYGDSSAATELQQSLVTKYS